MEDEMEVCWEILAFLGANYQPLTRFNHHSPQSYPAYKAQTLQLDDKADNSHNDICRQLVVYLSQNVQTHSTQWLANIPSY